MSNLRNLSKRIKSATPVVPSTDDAAEELRRLMLRHDALVKASVALHHMASDRKVRTGPKKDETIPCRLPEDAAQALLEQGEARKKQAKAMERELLAALRRLPVWTLFLSRVYGMGPVIGASLLAAIDFTKCEKPSQLKRFCGVAVIDGRLERPRAGERRHYHVGLRTRLYQWATASYKNGAKRGKWVDGADLDDELDADLLETREKTGRVQYLVPSDTTPDGTESKYLRAWADFVHRAKHSERWTVDEKGKAHYGERSGGIVNRIGMWRACGLLLDDLYMVGRSAHGLPVWPSFYAAKLGYQHASGRIEVNAPKLVTVDEVLDLIGDPSGMAKQQAAAE